MYAAVMMALPKGTTPHWSACTSRHQGRLHMGVRWPGVWCHWRFERATNFFCDAIATATVTDVWRSNICEGGAAAPLIKIYVGCANVWVEFNLF